MDYKFDKSYITMYQRENSRGQADKPMGFSKEFIIRDGDIESLENVVKYDNCTAKYKNGYNRGENFIKANCILADIDNTHSDNPNEWITHKEVEQILKNVKFYYYPSRNNMKQKGDRKPRPKEHFIFPINTINNVEEYCNTMKWIIDTFPNLHFDKAVKGPAQLNFGVENPEVTYVEGNINLSVFIQQNNSYCKIVNVVERQSVIPEGQRNNVLHQYALKMLTRLGDTSKAYQLYIEETKKCMPHLDEREINSIWNGTCKYYNNSIKVSDDYVSPDIYSMIKNDREWVIPPINFKAVQQLHKEDKKYRVFNIATAKLILEAVGISIRLNDMSGVVEVVGLPSKYNKEDASNLLTTLISDIASCMSYKRATPPIVQDSLNVIANENHYHPVIEIIQREKWDGKDRLNDIFDILNLKNELYKVLVRKWAIQTIALLFNSDNHSVSAEGVLVLQGKQGIGKTQFFRHLAINEKFFKGGATLDMGNKDCLMSATKVWICELGEIDSTTKKEQSALKAFLTENIDRFRAPYARNETVKVRRTSFCGTVNPKQYLRDETGNRRYWTIPIEKINLKKIFEYSSEWYIQFWRQLYEEYRQNPKGYLLTANEKEKVNLNNNGYEAVSFGEDEFISNFDIEEDKNKWIWSSATEIANLLNERCKHLRIDASKMGKLINKIEDKRGITFDRKKSNGRQLILCPPLRKKKDSFEKQKSLKEELLPYKINIESQDEDLSKDNVIF